MKLAFKVIIGVFVIMGTAIYSYYIAFNHYVDDDLTNKHKIEKGEVINNKIYTMSLGIFDLPDSDSDNKTLKYSVSFDYKILKFDETLNLNQINLKLQSSLKKINAKDLLNNENLKETIKSTILNNLDKEKIEFRELVLEILDS